jgi:hypothetical protein
MCLIASSEYLAMLVVFEEAGACVYPASPRQHPTAPFYWAGEHSPGIKS